RNSDGGSGVYLSTMLFARLGVAQPINAKSKMIPGTGGSSPRHVRFSLDSDQTGRRWRSVSYDFLDSYTQNSRPIQSLRLRAPLALLEFQVLSISRSSS